MGILNAQLELNSCWLKSIKVKKEKGGNIWGQNHQSGYQQRDAFELVLQKQVSGMWREGLTSRFQCGMGGESPKQPSSHLWLKMSFLCSLSTSYVFLVPYCTVMAFRRMVIQTMRAAMLALSWRKCAISLSPSALSFTCAEIGAGFFWNVFFLCL